VIGLDTNVLLRLTVHDDPVELARARACFARAAAEGPVFLGPVVLSEFAWTLSRTFKIGRREIADHIQGFLDSDDIEVAFDASARRSLAAYRVGKADFPDYFIASVNAELGCSATMTFDKKALDFADFRAVP
jgi:predicted nucleic-acid-binding protein